ncbi:hypothetical protein QBC46DRAFT_350587 [Diplogelasinospora grovesii]|uniref:Uncharacterized protein n=1 Tax=Diplogelasinospora grovesii TaxID=303347 RepID=A0AAN6S8M5_9PEZI|nr:hypothetical protein QBC46DRAFT_350587 [Diplogelasinospora grovesii]
MSDDSSSQGSESGRGSTKDGGGARLFSPAAAPPGRSLVLSEKRWPSSRLFDPRTPPTEQQRRQMLSMNAAMSTASGTGNSSAQRSGIASRPEPPRFGHVNLGTPDSRGMNALASQARTQQAYRQASYAWGGNQQPGQHNQTQPPIAPSAQSQSASTKVDIHAPLNELFSQEMRALSIGDNETRHHPAYRRILDIAQQSQRRLVGLFCGTRDESGAPKGFLELFLVDVQELYGNMGQQSREAQAMTTDLYHLRDECERLKAVLASQAVEYEQFRHKAESRVNELGCQLQNEREILRSYQDMVKTLEAQRALDERTIKHLKEQVDGKRNMWMEIHSDAKEKALAWETATRTSSPLTGSTYAPDSQLVHSAGPWNPPSSVANGPRPIQRPAPGSRPSTATSHTQARALVSGPHFRNPSVGGGVLPAPNYQAQSSWRSGMDQSSGPDRSIPLPVRASEYGSPIARPKPPTTTITAPSQANSQNDIVAQRWAEEYTNLFTLIFDFCRALLGEKSPHIDGELWRRIQVQSPRLESYMCEVLYPGRRQEGASHAKYLLDEDRSSRPYFIARLIIQHIVNNVLSYEGWKGLNDEADTQLREIDAKLKATEVYKTFERQALIDAQANIIARIVEHQDWRNRRHNKINEHWTALKAMVGILLPDPSSPKYDDFRQELHRITEAAWDLSTKLLRSRLTFQYVWNDTCSKFSMECHEARNSQLDPLTLQNKQFRLQLVITPGITMRNDQGMSIEARMIRKALVDVMDQRLTSGSARDYHRQTSFTSH